MVLRQVHRLCESPCEVEASRFHQYYYYDTNLPGPDNDPDDMFRVWWKGLTISDKGRWYFGWRTPDQAAQYCGHLRDIWKKRPGRAFFPSYYLKALHKFALLPQHVRAGQTQVVFVKDEIILREEAS